jgi:hypothetical protein
MSSIGEPTTCTGHRNWWNKLFLGYIGGRASEENQGGPDDSDDEPIEGPITATGLLTETRCFHVR